MTMSSTNKAPPKVKRVWKISLSMSPEQLIYFDKLLTILVGFTTFGASITFGLNLAEFKAPPDLSNLRTVETLIAVSWALFVIGLLLASFATICLYAYQHVFSETNTSATTRWLRGIVREFINNRGGLESAIILSIGLILLLLPLTSALLCLAVVLTMYVKAVGIIALICFGIGFVVVVVFNVIYLALDGKQLEEGKDDDRTNKLAEEISKAVEVYLKSRLNDKLDNSMIAEESLHRKV
jgi:hypothetical protein